MTTTQPALVPAVVAADIDSSAVRQPSHELEVLGVKRAQLELAARSLDQYGKARATVARRLSTT